MSEETPSLIADRYRLDELIGRGPAGEVWRAHDERADWTVAVKILTAGSRELLTHHAQTVARVVHPNVAMVLDIGEHDGSPYLVMEYLTGLSLGEELAEHGPFGIVEACDLIGQAAAGLDAAHRAGVVHGEVEPDSFRRAGSGVLKVVGFGIQRDPDRGDGVSGPAGPGGAGAPAGPGGARAGDGKPAEAVRITRYSAPEQLDGHAGPASDLYALGCVCYELLCNRPPFVEFGEELADQHRNAAPEPPTRLRPAIPAELEQLILAMLAKDPAARPASGDVVRRRLAGIARPGATQRTGPLPTLQTPTAPGQAPTAPGQAPQNTSGPNPPHLGGAAHPQGAGHPQGTGPHQAPGAQQGAGLHQAQGTGPQHLTAQLPPFQGRPGDTAIYEGPLAEPPAANQNRRLIVQLVAAVGVIAVATAGFIALSGRERPDTTPPAVTTETSLETATPETTQPTTPPPAIVTSPDPNGLVQTLGPANPLQEVTPQPKDTSGLRDTPAGGWLTWLGRFDEAVALQAQTGGMNPRAAEHAHKKLGKAIEQARKGRVDSARKQVMELAEELAKAREHGEISPSGPLVEFLGDWGLNRS